MTADHADDPLDDIRDELRRHVYALLDVGPITIPECRRIIMRDHPYVLERWVAANVQRIMHDAIRSIMHERSLRQSVFKRIESPPHQSKHVPWRVAYRVNPQGQYKTVLDMDRNEVRYVRDSYRAMQKPLERRALVFDFLLKALMEHSDVSLKVRDRFEDPEGWLADLWSKIVGLPLEEGRP